MNTSLSTNDAVARYDALGDYAILMQRYGGLTEALGRDLSKATRLAIQDEQDKLAGELDNLREQLLTFMGLGVVIIEGELVD